MLNPGAAAQILAVHQHQQAQQQQQVANLNAAAAQIMRQQHHAQVVSQLVLEKALINRRSNSLRAINRGWSNLICAVKSGRATRYGLVKLGGAAFNRAALRFEKRESPESDATTFATAATAAAANAGSAGDVH